MVSVALVCTLAGAAMAATFRGVIIDANNNSVIDGTTITIESTGKQLMTDFAGKFSIKSDDSIVYISVSHVGYEPLVKVPVSQNNETTIALVPKTTKLNPIVITAHRSQKESFKVSQSVTVFESENIISEGHTTVTDVIRHAPGVDVNDAGPFRARPVIRGAYGSRTLVLVDGERLNDHREVVDFAGVSMSLVDVNEIQRVEVLNGPSSVLYGSDAMAGVINIITKHRTFSPDMHPFISYDSRYSTADELSSNRVDFGLGAEKFAFSAGVQYKEANNDFQPPDNWQTDDSRYLVYRPEFYDSLNSARGTNWSNERLVNSRVRVNNYDLGLAYKLGDRHRLNFDAGIFRASDIGYPGVPNDSTPFYFFWPNHDRENFSLSYAGTGLGSRLAKLDGKFYYQKITKDFFTDFMDAVVIQAGPPPNPPTIKPLTSFSTTEVNKFGLNLQGLYQLNRRATLIMGVDSWKEDIDGQSTSITRFEGFGPFPFNDTSVAASVPENQWYALGVYANGDIELNSIILNAGARFDNLWLNTEKTPGYVDDNDNPLPSEDDSYSSLNGSLGLVISLNKEINIVTNAGTAYRAPNVVERFFYGSASGREVRPNPAIKPERAYTVDLGLKAARENAGYSLIGFYSNYNDFTQLQMFAVDTNTSQPLWRYENVEDVSIYGIELLTEAKLNSGIYGGFTFTYQRGENKTDDKPLFVSPVKSSLKVGYRETANRYFGEVNIYRVEAQNRIPSTSTLDDIATRGYTLVNTSAGIKLWNSLSLNLGVVNLFDEVYSQPFNGRNPDNPVPEPGRNFVISTKVDVGL
jgi:hemoglobin/transferrin/lactoferrin receptor protein